jgi:hypothetical protein
MTELVNIRTELKTYEMALRIKVFTERFELEMRRFKTESEVVPVIKLPIFMAIPVTVEKMVAAEPGFLFFGMPTGRDAQDAELLGIN